MLVLKFKRRGYKKEVEIEGANFRGIYYDLSMLLNPSLSTFEEEQYILSDEDYDEDFYMYLLETAEDEALDYYNSFVEKITDSKYKDFIDSVMQGANYRDSDYEFYYKGVCYFDSIIDYSNLSYKEQEQINQNLLATGKVEIDFNDRLYTEDYNLYKQLEIELEDE
ncbi:Uncharacterised protein [Gemella morbillorum]|uniref:hypothetical protein n=1 Tax=Gemella morbillorum TaxID=29391 RepID=UPI000DA3CFF3|nr:hypothetical protein [Gemella morbillorum]UBH80456.1 hypothetical protein LA320_07095 [Gemella morbillorum]SQH55851.1 Uncharacterised protein [Gemella morbillorum]